MPPGYSRPTKYDLWKVRGSWQHFLSVQDHGTKQPLLMISLINKWYIISVISTGFWFTFPPEIEQIMNVNVTIIKHLLQLPHWHIRNDAILSLIKGNELLTTPLCLWYYFPWPHPPIKEQTRKLPFSKTQHFLGFLLQEAESSVFQESTRYWISSPILRSCAQLSISLWLCMLACTPSGCCGY